MKVRALSILLMSPLLVLAGCGDKDAVVAPDKEPSQVEAEYKNESGNKKKLTVYDVSTLFTGEKFLKDYKDELAKHGYKEPVKEILLADGDVKKMGAIYQVEDGLAVLEYDDATKSVIAVTSFENMEQVEIQEKKTMLYALENELNQSTDDIQKNALQKEIDQGWQEIAELEQGQH